MTIDNRSPNLSVFSLSAFQVFSVFSVLECFSVFFSPPFKSSPVMKLLMDNLPASLHSQHDSLVRCLEAMNRVMPLKAVYLFGSHARGEARADSDVDLCVVAEGAAAQLKAAQSFRHAMRPIRPKPAFTLLPIALERLAEKKAAHDAFFATVLREGVLIAQEN